MVKVKVDVTDSDPKDAKPRIFEQPTPGMYTAKIHQIEPGFKNDDNGKPDREQPRLEIIYEIVAPKFKGARLWEYISLVNPKQKWKLDQFCQAFGITTDTKRKASFDTEELVGLPCKLRVRGETQNGEYRARAGDVMAGEDTDLLEGDEEEEEKEDELEEDEDDLAEDDGEDEGLSAVGASADEGDDAAIARLEELAAEAELDPDDYETWAELALALGGEGSSDDNYDDMEDEELRKELGERDLHFTAKTKRDALIQKLRDDDAQGDPI